MVITLQPNKHYIWSQDGQEQEKMTHQDVSKGFLLIQLFTDTQNAWCWKVCLEVIWSNTLAQAGPPRTVCSEPCPDCFSTSPRMEISHPLGSLSRWSVTLTVKICFLTFWQNPLFSWLCLLLLVLPLGKTAKRLTPSSLHPSFRYLYILMRSPLSSLFSGLKQFQSSQPFSC